MILYHFTTLSPHRFYTQQNLKRYTSFQEAFSVGNNEDQFILFLLLRTLSLPVLNYHSNTTTHKRAEMIKTFNHGSTRVLILNQQISIDGVDLQYQCRLMVPLDIPYGPGKLEQIAGRVHRLSQPRDTICAILQLQSAEQIDQSFSNWDMPNFLSKGVPMVMAQYSSQEQRQTLRLSLVMFPRLLSRHRSSGSLLQALLEHIKLCGRPFAR